MNRLLLDRLYFALIYTCVIFLTAVSAGAQDKDWRPVTPDELTAKAPIVEPDADAEAIFWEVRIDDSSSDDLSMRHYVRVKIFTERGREKYSKFDVPFSKWIKVKDLAARVIRPDGTITEIRKEDIFEREIIKAGGVKIKAKSFAVPNIEPGVIIEYRYRETRSDSGAKGMRLTFQRDVPVQNLAYYYKPYNSQQPSYQNYNFRDVKFVKDEKGFWLAKRTNVPAFREEPRMPPEDMVRPWMLLTGTRINITDASGFSFVFSIKDPRNQAGYWAAVSRDYSGFREFMTKPSNEVKELAAKVTAGASTPDEKLRRIYDFCQTQIRNITFDTSITDEEKAKSPAVKSIPDVVKRRAARSQYIDMLFGAMTHAAGLETRIALTANRSEMFFEPSMTNDQLLHPAAIAVNVNGEWKLFNPGMPYLPYGMLVWYEEDTWALLVGESSYLWRRTPLTEPSRSHAKRSGKFKLLEDGTLEGNVAVEYTGHPALTYRMENYDESADKRIENLKDEIKQRISTAEVSDLQIENVTDAAKPLVHRYKVRIPNYAQRTGKRLFLQPGFFEYGSSALFSGSTRKFDIFFRYPWAESDDIEFHLPDGFELDNADSPGLLTDQQKIGLLDIRIGVDPSSAKLVYNRSFHFGGGGNVLFPAASYGALKGLFDQFQKSENHTISLKQK